MGYPWRLNPTPYRDARFRQEAENLYQQLMIAVNRGDLVRAEPIRLELFNLKLVGWVLPWLTVDKRLAFDDRLASLEIIFTKQEGSSAALFVPAISSQPMAIVLYGVDKNELTLDNDDYLRNCLIHEFIHLLDYLRYDRLFKYLPATHPDYYHSPAEFNAYYQAGFSKLEHELHRLVDSGNILQVEELLRWETLRNKLTYFWNKEFLESIQHSAKWNRFVRRVRDGLSLLQGQV